MYKKSTSFRIFFCASSVDSNVHGEVLWRDILPFIFCEHKTRLVSVRIFVGNSK